MSGPQRQIAALRRATARRERLEQALRAELAQRQVERGPLVEQAHAAQQQVMELDALAQLYRRRAQAMMTGAEPFSIEALTAIRRYVETVDEQLAAARNTAADAQQAVHAKEGEIAAARRSIAQNRGRIDLCMQRITKLERVLEGIAADAEDEEIEEMALARASHA
jgi:type III secretion system HrpB7-like protein